MCTICVDQSGCARECLQIHCMMTYQLSSNNTYLQIWFANDENRPLTFPNEIPADSPIPMMIITWWTDIHHFIRKLSLSTSSFGWLTIFIVGLLEQLPYIYCHTMHAYRHFTDGHKIMNHFSTRKYMHAAPPSLSSQTIMFPHEVFHISKITQPVSERWLVSSGSHGNTIK